MTKKLPPLAPLSIQEAKKLRLFFLRPKRLRIWVRFIFGRSSNGQSASQMSFQDTLLRLHFKLDAIKQEHPILF